MICPLWPVPTEDTPPTEGGEIAGPGGTFADNVVTCRAAERGLLGRFLGGINDRCLLGLCIVWLKLEPTFRKVMRYLNLPSCGGAVARGSPVRREAYRRCELARFESVITLNMEAICSSETSVLTTATWCKVPKDIFQFCNVFGRS
jgi:hypothetical protein